MLSTFSIPSLLNQYRLVKQQLPQQEDLHLNSFRASCMIFSSANCNVDKNRKLNNKNLILIKTFLTSQS